MRFSGADNHSKASIPDGSCRPPSNTWFIGNTRVFLPNGISIGSAVFVGLTDVDKQTHRASERQTAMSLKLWSYWTEVD